MKNKLVLLLKSIYWSGFLFLRNLFVRSNLSSISDDYLVISLTTYPKRINTVFLTIESIFYQSYSDYKVVLYLSKDEFFDEKLPSSIERLKRRGLDVKYVHGNLRSYKKLHYALSEYNNHIITADDDVIYPYDWIMTMKKFHDKEPLDIVFFRGHEIITNSNGSLCKYNDFPEVVNYSRSLMNLPTGVSGVFYPSGCFHQDVMRDDIFMALAPNADDLWYKAMSYLNGRYCTLANDRSIHFTPILGTQVTSLKQSNTSDNYFNNDIQFKNIISRYDILIKNG